MPKREAFFVSQLCRTLFGIFFFALLSQQAALGLGCFDKIARLRGEVIEPHEFVLIQFSSDDFGILTKGENNLTNRFGFRRQKLDPSKFEFVEYSDLDVHVGLSPIVRVYKFGPADLNAESIGDIIFFSKLKGKFEDRFRAGKVLDLLSETVSSNLTPEHLHHYDTTPGRAGIFGLGVLAVAVGGLVTFFLPTSWTPDLKGDSASLVTYLSDRNDAAYFEDRLIGRGLLSFWDHWAQGIEFPELSYDPDIKSLTQISEYLTYRNQITSARDAQILDHASRQRDIVKATRLLEKNLQDPNAVKDFLTRLAQARVSLGEDGLVNLAKGGQALDAKIPFSVYAPLLEGSELPLVPDQIHIRSLVALRNSNFLTTSHSPQQVAAWRNFLKAQPVIGAETILIQDPNLSSPRPITWDDVLFGLD